MAVGKETPPYSFLTILPHEQDENKMFRARFDQRLVVESDSDKMSIWHLSSLSGTSAAVSPWHYLFHSAIHLRSSSPAAGDNFSMHFWPFVLVPVVP